MPKPTDSLSIAVARLHAAVSVLANAESGLRDSKIDPERAALMAEFCAWAASGNFGSDADAARLSNQVKDGLERLRALL